MQNNIKIDKELLLTDLYIMKSYLESRSNKRDFKQDLNEFLVLNETLGDIVGIKFDQYELFGMKPQLIDTIISDDSKSRDNFYSYFMNNMNTINQMGDNFNEILFNNDIINFFIPEKMKKYSEKDFKDIILSFFSSINDTYYKIVKKYFDEKRISMGETSKDGDIGGYFASLKTLDTGYIFVPSNDLDSNTARILVHELGHAIDNELFLTPQQKTLKTVEDTLLELPSTCFETIFCDYLIKNKIDYDGGLMLFNEGVTTTDDFFGEVEECTEKMPTYVDEEGYVETEEGKIIKFRDSLLYSIAYFFSFNLNEIYKSNPKEFSKIFYNIISSRKECTLEELINKTKIDYEEFIKCNLFKNTIEENNKKLIKRFNL